ncbi:MAG: YIP1 family protein [Acidobacteriota bacterium]
MQDDFPPSAPPPGAPSPPAAPPPGYAPPPVGGGSQVPATHLEPLPWDRRRELGFGQALIETIKMIATEPQQSMARLRSDGDYVGPLLFAVLVTWIPVIIAQLWSTLFQGAMMGSMGSGTNELAGMMGGTVIFLIVYVFAWPFILAFGIAIGTGMYHLSLMVVGATSASPTGIEGTFKALCYSQVASIALVIPLLGQLIAFVGQMVLTFFGFREAHETTSVKAILGLLMPLILCCLCIVAMSMMFGAAMMQGFNAG